MSLKVRKLFVTPFTIQGFIVQRYVVACFTKIFLFPTISHTTLKTSLQEQRNKLLISFIFNHFSKSLIKKKKD